ncbi:MAG: tRNA 2-thiouridine(34) synthase MnmA [Candidatus Cloacimonadota bacterium]|nr:tRNA 2-thiouridine(34) synthase MnmA [Candidatus Cloacimonadota bacterium]
MNIAVAMSGGVDSSVVAAILQEAGHQVFGVTMRHFNSYAYGFSAEDSLEKSIEDARQVCNKLGIQHHVVDVQDSFKKIVEANFIKEYKNGRTPNPCTLCNPTIKWGVLLEKCKNMGAEKMATGHYTKLHEKAGEYHIFRAEDRAKDQGYMLWQLSQKQLAQTLFPLAELQKKQVRKIAEKLGIPVHTKKDSQEVCFIPGHYEDYLQKHIKFTPGDIVLPDGKVIGRHSGLPLYTVGQRKGLNTPWSSALYVQRLDVENNRLVVTDDPDDLFQEKFEIGQINWLSKKPQSQGITVQIRYNSNPKKVFELKLEDSSALVRLEKPARAITPGQSAVFYKENELLGGGIIK